jgi:hypothetical protein
VDTREECCWSHTCSLQPSRSRNQWHPRVQYHVHSIQRRPTESMLNEQERNQWHPRVLNSTQTRAPCIVQVPTIMLVAMGRWLLEREEHPASCRSQQIPTPRSSSGRFFCTLGARVSVSSHSICQVGEVGGGSGGDGGGDGGVGPSTGRLARRVPLLVYLPSTLPAGGAAAALSSEEPVSSPLLSTHHVRGRAPHCKPSARPRLQPLSVC